MYTRDNELYTWVQESYIKLEIVERNMRGWHLRRVGPLVVLVLACMLLYWKRWRGPGIQDETAGPVRRGTDRQQVDAAKPFDIHVVEEHHEVLPHWFEAAERGVIPKSGNYLLHIDGHGDDGPPDFVPGYDMYRWPRGPEDIRLMMQSNDLFIMAAAMVGMFKHCIWVWPAWDQSNHLSNLDKGIIHMGEKRYTDSEGHSQKTVCLCQEKAEGTKCYAMNESIPFTGNITDKESLRIPDEQCVLSGRSVSYEEIREDLAIDRLMSGTWIPRDASLMIDIDEDYFGCELAAKPLVEERVIWSKVRQLDHALSTFICPTETKHELEADRLITRVTREAHKLCPSHAENCKSIFKLIIKYTKDAVAKVFSTAGYFCQSPSENSNLRAMLLLRKLLDFNKNQLGALIKIGFCMQTSPKSYNFRISPDENSGLFQVCHGFNVPNASVVLEHSPDLTEVKSRTEILRALVGSRKIPDPNIVTVCRSVRDGYTPRDYFKTIEENIIKAFKDKYTTHSYSVKYDKDLLGGKEGWPSKHKL